MLPLLPRAPPAPEALEVRCAGCGETLEVEAGLTEFICPDCAMPQALPPELMPERRRKRALPLPPGVADARCARLPCASCGAVLSVPHGLERFACPLCGVELAVDQTLLRQYLASTASSAVSVVVPPAAVALTSALEAQEVPPSQAIHVAQVRVEPYNQPHCVEQAEVARPTRVTVGWAQQEHVNHSIHREGAHVEQLSECIPRPSRKKARFQVGPESVCAVNVQVDALDQVHHAPESQRGPSNYSLRTDQAQVQGHSNTIARDGKHKTGYAVEPSLISTKSEKIVPLNQVVHVQQGRETPSDAIRAQLEQVEPDSNTTGGSQKRKKKGLSSANEGLHLRRSKRLAKEPQGVVDPVQQQTALPDQDLSHPSGFERISTRLRPRSLPQHQRSKASKQSGNVDLITPFASSNPGISEAGWLPRCYSQSHPPEIGLDLANVSSNSLHEHEMALACSSETNQLDVTEPEGRLDSHQRRLSQRPSALNDHNRHFHAEQEQVELPNQLMHGQKAQEEPSCDENDAEQVQVLSHSKNVAALPEQKRMGMMGSNKGIHLRNRLFSSAGCQMTLAASCSRPAASLPLPTSTSSPTTTSPSVVTKRAQGHEGAATASSCSRSQTEVRVMSGSGRKRFLRQDRDPRYQEDSRGSASSQHQEDPRDGASSQHQEDPRGTASQPETGTSHCRGPRTWVSYSRGLQAPRTWVSLRQAEAAQCQGEEQQPTQTSTEEEQTLETPGQAQRTRGKTRAISTLKSRAAGRISVLWNPRTGLPWGEGSTRLSTFNGALARACPIDVLEWRKMPRNIKDRCWADVEMTFEVEPRRRKRILSMIAKLWRCWRSRLRRQYINPIVRANMDIDWLSSNEWPEEWMKSPVDVISDKEWRRFVKLSLQPQALKKSVDNTEIAKKYELRHLTSRKSLSFLDYELRQKRGDLDTPSSRDELFLVSRTTKEGVIRQPRVMEFAKNIAELKEKVEKGEFTPTPLHDILAEATRLKEYPGRVRSIGPVCISTYVDQPRIEVTKSRLAAENEELRRQLASIDERILKRVEEVLADRARAHQDSGSPSVHVADTPPAASIDPACGPDDTGKFSTLSNNAGGEEMIGFVLL